MAYGVSADGACRMTPVDNDFSGESGWDAGSQLTGGERFKVDVIDTWNMTIQPEAGVPTMQPKADNGYFLHDPAQPTLSLPGRPWMAVRLTRVET